MTPPRTNIRTFTQIKELRVSGGDIRESSVFNVYRGLSPRG